MKTTLKPFNIEWTYVIGPANTAHFVISQRLDGPFAGDKVGGAGHFYLSLEEYENGKWEHKFVIDTLKTFVDAVNRMKLEFKRIVELEKRS